MQRLTNSFRPTRSLGLIGLLLVASFLGACSAFTPGTNPVQRSMVNFKMGSQTEGRESRILIITIRNVDHHRLVGSGSVAAARSAQPLRYRDLLNRWERDYGLLRVADWPLSELKVRCMVFEVGAGYDIAAVLTSLGQETIVETAQKLQSFRTITSTYNDPYRKIQHSLASLGIDQSHRFATGKGVRVAVIDTGLDDSHQELRGKVKVKRNMVNGDSRDFNQDVHGTAIAGVIAATANNANGIVGVAPDATIMAMKACWQTRPGYDAAICNSFTLAKSLNASIAAKADVINLSLAGPADPLLDRLVRRAMTKEIVVVGAVDPVKPESFPASTPGVLAVAVPRNRYRNVKVAGRHLLRAPGQQVVSIRPGNQYDTFSGSSISAAHVSGLAALAKEHKPHLNGQKLARILRDTVDPSSGQPNACVMMARLLNVSGQDCSR